jgi:hypothetical protein
MIIRGVGVSRGALPTLSYVRVRKTLLIGAVRTSVGDRWGPALNQPLHCLGPCGSSRSVGASTGQECCPLGRKQMVDPLDQ